MNATETRNGTPTVVTTRLTATPSWAMVLLQGALTVAAWAALLIQLGVVLPAINSHTDPAAERERLQLLKEQEETLKRIQVKSATILAIQERQERLLNKGNK